MKLPVVRTCPIVPQVLVVHAASAEVVFLSKTIASAPASTRPRTSFELRIRLPSSFGTSSGVVPGRDSLARPTVFGLMCAAPLADISLTNVETPSIRCGRVRGRARQPTCQRAVGLTSGPDDAPDEDLNSIDFVKGGTEMNRRVITQALTIAVLTVSLLQASGLVALAGLGHP